MQKLTPSDRTEIVKLFSSGIKQAEIARQFNVSQQTIYFILNPDKLKENKAKLKANYNPVTNKIRKDRYLKKKKLNSKNK